MVATIRAMERWDVIIIGGGAAGLVAAGATAGKSLKVLVCEKKHRTGLKVGISGKGRGNVTNDKPVETFIEGYRAGGSWLHSAFARFFVADTIELLERREVPCVVERGGRVFPQSGKAGDVVNALYRFARHDGAAVRTKAPVEEIKREKNGFSLRIGNQWLAADKVILAAGGQSYPATGSTGDGFRLAAALGHTIVPTHPALAPLVVKNLPADLKLHLRNVTVALYDGKRKTADGFGEALLENGTIGGPVPIGFARDVPDLQAPRLLIDLKPALDPPKLDTRLQRDLAADGKAPLKKVLQGLLPKALIPLFIEKLELDEQKRCAEVDKKTRKAIGDLCKRWELPVVGVGEWSTALVTAGGVDLAEVDPRTMESKKVPNLFLCGEVLDIDGISGGYNLQAAFSTGYVAGRAAAGYVT